MYRSLALALFYGGNVRVFFVGSVQPGNSLAALPSSKVDDRPEKIWDFKHDGVHVPVPAQIVTKIQWRRASQLYF